MRGRVIDVPRQFLSIFVFFFSGGAVFVEYFTGFCAIRLKQSSSLLLIVFFRFNRKMAGMKGMKE